MTLDQRADAEGIAGAEESRAALIAKLIAKAGQARAACESASDTILAVPGSVAYGAGYAVLRAYVESIAALHERLSPPRPPKDDRAPYQCGHLSTQPVTDKPLRSFFAQQICPDCRGGA